MFNNMKLEILNENKIKLVDEYGSLHISSNGHILFIKGLSSEFMDEPIIFDHIKNIINVLFPNTDYSLGTICI